jgi:hypothetical protein
MSGWAFVIVAPGQVADPSEVDVDMGLRAGLVETAGPVPTFAMRRARTSGGRSRAF